MKKVEFPTDNVPLEETGVADIPVPVVENATEVAPVIREFLEALVEPDEV